MIINFKLASNDNYFVDSQDYEINLNDSSHFSYTFWNNHNKFRFWYNLYSLDLLYLSLAVFAADRLNLRDNAIDGWTREFNIHIPVLKIQEWIIAKDILEKMLSFLSGDIWHINFRQRELTKIELQHFNKMKESKMEVKEYERVCMFSGGLDSFIGAIDVLETRKGNTLFVSHYGGGKGTKEYQDILKEKFIEKYSLNSRDFHQYYAKVVAGEEDTTRTRSFMFFHAIAVASALGKSVELIIPENGVISLNVPCTFSRLGTSSTRTTHPNYLSLFQQLLNILNIPVTLVNPYQFFTKGEMLMNCKNQSFMKKNIGNTMSCSHPDNGRMLKETETRHCGYCLPCVIRRAAIKKLVY
ncbi:MAG: Qat anti-phage system QueC-like protein QatC [Longibaculum sp.]